MRAYARLFKLSSFFISDPSVETRLPTRFLPPIMAEESYSLHCTVTGAQNLNATIEYQWFKNNSMLREGGHTLQLLSITISNAGMYTCQALVTSRLLLSSITTAKSNPVNITVICMLIVHDNNNNIISIKTFSY